MSRAAHHGWDLGRCQGEVCRTEENLRWWACCVASQVCAYHFVGQISFSKKWTLSGLSRGHPYPYYRINYVGSGLTFEASRLYPRSHLCGAPTPKYLCLSRLPSVIESQQLMVATRSRTSCVHVANMVFPDCRDHRDCALLQWECYWPAEKWSVQLWIWSG